MQHNRQTTGTKVAREPKPKTVTLINGDLSRRTIRCVPRGYKQDGNRHNDFKYEIVEVFADGRESISHGYVRSKNGPGARGGNRRYYEWLEDDGTVRNHMPTLMEAVAENIGGNAVSA